MPPGPRGLPIIGNVRQLDAKNPLLSCTKWRQLYGDIYKINLLGQYVIVVSRGFIFNLTINSAISYYELSHKRTSHVIACTILLFKCQWWLVIVASYLLTLTKRLAYHSLKLPGFFLRPHQRCSRQQTRYLLGETSSPQG